MEIVLDKARDYILALKDAGNFSLEDIANISGIPLPTVRNICSGKTPDARFGTVAKIVISLGGDLNELIGYEKKKEIAKRLDMSPQLLNYFVQSGLRGMRKALGVKAKKE